MARARNIKPAFFKNYELADAGPVAQILFAGLWCLADREGRLEDKPRLIKAELFPYYDCDVNGELTVLERLGFVRRYVNAGISIIEVLNFKKHQAPHKTEKDSVLPPYEAESCQPTPLQPAPSGGNGGLTVKQPSNNDGKTPDLLIPDSLSSDSLIPDSSSQASTGPVSVKTKSEAMEGFAQFWLCYPRKTAKQSAEKAWAKLRPDRSLQAQMLAAVSLQAKTPDWTKDGGSFIPHASTWINGKRWEDELPAPLLTKHTGFNGERDYAQGMEARSDGTYKF